MTRILICAMFAIGVIACERNDNATSSDTNVTKTVLVTGATGRQGGAVARELLQRGYRVRALTRNPRSSRASALAELGIEVVKGDYDDAASLDQAFAGTYGAFSVTDFWEHGYEREVQHGRNLVDAAHRAGTEHFVFSSVASAQHDTGIPHFDSKFEIEKYLQASGLAFTVLRPVSFMENWSLDDEEILAGSLTTARSPEKKHQYISVRDIGRLAGEAFDNPAKWRGVSIDIAGDEATLNEFTALLSRMTAREIGLETLTWDEYEKRFGAEMTTMSKWFDEVGYNADVETLRRRFPEMLTLEQYFSQAVAE